MADDALDLAGMTAERDLYAQRWHSIEGQLATAQERITTLTGALEAAQLDVGSLQAREAELLAKLAEAKQDLETATQATADAGAQATNLLARLTQADGASAAALKRVAELEQALQMANTAATEQQRRAQDAEAFSAKVLSHPDVMMAKEAARQAAVAELEAKLAALKVQAN